MKNERLSKKQKQLLEAIAAMPLYMEGVRTPLYIENWDRAESWYSETERRHWLENLEERGFITIKDRCFLSLTEKGRVSVEEK